MPLKHTVWNACLRRGGPGLILDDTDTPFVGIPNPAGGWAADPFLFETDEKLYIFAELFFYRKQKGVIGYCTYQDRRFSRWRTVVEGPFHLSYPYLFRGTDPESCALGLPARGETDIYMIPESNEDNSIRLYRATRFPDEWVCEAKLCEGDRFADTTYVGESLFLSYNHYLHTYTLLCADGEKKLTPVRSGYDRTGKTRPGGKCFEKDGLRILPTQNGEKHYGSGLVFNTVKPDTPESLPESFGIIRQINPDSITELNRVKAGPAGIHTYNYSEHFEVIDVRRDRFILADLFYRAVARIKKALSRN